MRKFKRLLKAWLGDADSQYRLALESMQDEARKPNPRAIHWAQRAQKSGHPDAFMLLTSYLLERGEEKEAMAGIVLAWQMDAEKGEAGAQYSLGRAYEEGVFGMPKDLEKALFWYTKAAIGGHEGGQDGVSRLCKRT